MNIAVLAGGTSTERAISIISGTQVCKALRSRGHRAVLLDVFCGLDSADPAASFPEEYDTDAAAAYMHSFDDKIESMKSRRSFFGPGVLSVCQSADTVFMALHGANGEDGKIQAAFELMGIPYTGSSYLGSALAMDKNLTKQLFASHGVPTPKGIVVSEKDGKRVTFGGDSVPFPCVVKPACGGSSVGVSIANTEEEYQAALDEAFRYESVLIVEQYVKGREFSVGIVDGEAYPVIEIAPVSGFYNYENKYNGSTVETCPAHISDEVRGRLQSAALAAYHALGLNSYARIDVMMDEDENPYCLEANTLPGMTPTSLLPQEAAALGIDFPSLCEKLIEVSVRR